jgi:hypothetical protein
VSSSGASPMIGRIRLGKAFVQLVMSGLRSGNSGADSGVTASGMEDTVGDGVEEDEGADCRRELRISVERESRAGCKYPSNQRLKQESYWCFKGVHSGSSDLPVSRLTPSGQDRDWLTPFCYVV